MLEALHSIADKFASPDQYGPRVVADFDNLTNPEDRSIRQRAAFERVNELLARLGIQASGHS